MNRVIEVDAEHALAQSIFGESGHKFTKMKRACRVAVDDCIKWPADKEVRNLEIEQQLLLDKHVRLAEKMRALYGEQQLGRAAQECMYMYGMFMDIINTFVYPFEVATDC